MKIIVWAGMAALICLGIWDAGLLRARQRAEREIGEISARIALSHTELARARAALAAERPGDDRESFGTIADSVARRWAQEALARAEILQRRMRADPRQRIPEMQFLSPEDWARVAALMGPLAGEEDFRRAFAAVRLAAIRDFGQHLQSALRAYLGFSHEQLPADLSQLVPYLDPSIDPAILARYRMAETGSAYNSRPLQAGRPHPGPIEERPEVLADPIYDRIATISSGGLVGSYINYDHPAAREAWAAFETAHPGQRIGEPEDLAPYFKDPAAAARYVEAVKAQGDGN